MQTATLSESTRQTTPEQLERDAYFFDLRGYLILENAVSQQHVKQMNTILDEIIALDPPLKHGEWFGGVHAHSFGGHNDGMNLQQIYEAGEPFQRLIDHPSWIEQVTQYIGSRGTFDGLHGELFIDENFASLRGPGEAIGMHSGGHEGVIRTQYQHANGRFHCGQINILLALSDIGPGDGATMVVPGSHKANLEHPDFDKAKMGGTGPRSVDGVEGAIEVHLKAGDAILFVDALSHGSALRVNEGLRRICVYRYGPSWGNFRHPYYPTDAMLDRVTETQRKIILPTQPVKREPNRKVDTPSPPHARD